MRACRALSVSQVLVACLSVFGGLMAFNYHRELQVWAAPLLLVAFFASLVAHSVLSVFGAVLDALLLCFAVDLETNDGSSEKPYFMDRELLVSAQPLPWRSAHSQCPDLGPSPGSQL